MMNHGLAEHVAGHLAYVLRKCCGFPPISFLGGWLEGQMDISGQEGSLIPGQPPKAPVVAWVMVPNLYIPQYFPSYRSLLFAMLLCNDFPL